MSDFVRYVNAVSTHSRLKAAGLNGFRYTPSRIVSTHSRLKAAGLRFNPKALNLKVSTHSRLKAAGGHSAWHNGTEHGFNTQPPEGGWDDWGVFDKRYFIVSTHSRLKAAGYGQ